MIVRKATKFDLNEMKNIYINAITFMQNEGNFVQWQDKSIDIEDVFSSYIQSGNAYVAILHEEIVGLFALFYTPDSTYKEIKGQWLNDLPYVSIHKFAVKYKRQHIASEILYYIETHLMNGLDSIRIDTYKDNQSMRAFLRHHGFLSCGIISLNHDFTSQINLRMAYQKMLGGCTNEYTRYNHSGH